jgi:hypothetical protein
MKILLALAILAIPAILSAQTPVIPSVAVDGTTITAKIVNGTTVLSCVVPGSSSLPVGMTFDGTTLTVPKLSASELSLTGGTAYANGLYLAKFTSGAITWTPYTPPSASAGATYTVAIPATSGTSFTLVPGLTVAKGQVWSLTPVFSGAPNAAGSPWIYANLSLWVNSAGAAYVRLQNTTSTPIPASSVTVVVK